MRSLPLILLALGLPLTAHARDVYSERHPYGAISPGGVSVELNAFDKARAGYVWGIDAGYYMPLGEHAGLAVGGAFEQQIEFFGEDGLLHRFRIEPVVRLGWDNGNIFVFGLAGVGGAVIKLGADFLGGGYNGALTVEGGVGSWFSLGDQFSLGVEAHVDYDTTLTLGSIWGLSVSGKGLLIYHW